MGQRSGSVKELVATFIGAAATHPEQATEIYRRAVDTFAGLARDPKNAKVRRRLENVALDFAGALFRPATANDFQEIVRDTADAQAEYGFDDIAVTARRRELHNERNTISPPVSIAPQSITEDSTLGRIAVIKYNPSLAEKDQGIVQSQTVAYWQGTKREAQAVTVDINIVKPPVLMPGSLATPSPRPYCTVQYGSDGNRADVKLDVGYGQRITVPGNYVSVLVGMDPPMVGHGSGEMTVGASISMFAAPSQAPALLTEYIDSLAAAARTELIARPIKSVQLLSPQSSLLGGTALFEFLDYSGTTTLYRVQVANGALNTPVPLSNDVGFLRVTNNGAAAANFRLPFQLSL